MTDSIPLVRESRALAVATITLQSVDVSSIERAPSVRFSIIEDGRVMEASPPGGRIYVEYLDERTSRIVLTNAITNEIFADVVSRHHDAPSVGAEWNEPSLASAELASALYWSMWRMQQVNHD